MSVGSGNRWDPTRPDFAEGSKTIGARIEELDFDLNKPRGLTRPTLRLTDEDRAIMGPLAKAQTASDDPVDVLEGIYHCIRTEMQGDLTSSNPAVKARALSAIRRAFENLVRDGYPFA